MNRGILPLRYDGFIPHARAVRRFTVNTVTFTNQTTYAVWNDATERTALTLTFRKYRTDTRLILNVAASCNLSSGVAQTLFVGLTPNAGTTQWDVGSQTFAAASSRDTIAGTTEVSPGFYAGIYKIEPIFKADAASSVLFWSADDHVTFSVWETF